MRKLKHHCIKPLFEILNAAEPENAGESLYTEFGRMALQDDAMRTKGGTLTVLSSSPPVAAHRPGMPGLSGQSFPGEWLMPLTLVGHALNPTVEWVMP